MSADTLALTCLLHDIGATPAHLHATRLSFEFYGGMLAHGVVTDSGGERDQAEAVCETIIRHQDLGTVGSITLLGQVIQLATLYDNVGENPGLIHEQTKEDVIKAFPRDGWLGCFADTIATEERLKPWCHSTHVENFVDNIRGSKMWQAYG